MRIADVRKIWDDGEHNAFTDICFWKDAYWLVFRHAINHSVLIPGRIFILKSVDGGKWEKVAELVDHEFGFDLRDPKLMVAGDRLMVVAFRHILPEVRMPEHPALTAVDNNRNTWYARIWERLEVGPVASPLDAQLPQGLFQVGNGRLSAYGTQTLIFHTGDGASWTICGPKPPLFCRVWRPFKSESGFYAATHHRIHTQGNVHEYDGWVDLIFSDDGIRWKTVSRIASEGRPNETDLDIAPDGTMRALARREAPRQNSLLCVSHPPYTQWTHHELDRKIGGPLLRRLDGRLLVAGRYRADDGSGNFTGMFWLVGKDLEFIERLPSGRDNSYPGLARTGPGSALLSYYSGHEFQSRLPSNDEPDSLLRTQRTAIYIADLKW